MLSKALNYFSFFFFLTYLISSFTLGAGAGGAVSIAVGGSVAVRCRSH
jgi:hypothetical protein